MQQNIGFFGGHNAGLPRIDSDEFREGITEVYGCSDVREAIGRAVDDVWPVGMHEGEPVNRAEVNADLDPSYREHQREAVVDVVAELYVADNDVVTLSAPTGAGKSLILYAVVEVVSSVFGRHAFATTPLNALIDQMDSDEFLSSVITLKGKNNYSCVHPRDAGTPVDTAICQRADDFECQYKQMNHENGGCPYYGRKNAALMHPEVATNLSYLMANSMIPDMYDSKFDPRELVEIDECQKIEDFALGFVGFTVSKSSVPVVWDRIPRPPHGEDVDALAEWLQRDVMAVVGEKLSEYEAIPELSEEQVKKEEKLQDFYRKCENFINDYREHHWVAEKDTVYDEWAVKFQPIFLGRFLDKYLWSQGHKVVLSSATIPRGGFLEDIGLDDRPVGEVEVSSTFPPERRPVYVDDTVGKMTMAERDSTIPKVAEEVARLSDHYSDHKGFVHCHSYKIASRLYERLPRDVKARTRVQNSDDREQSLEDWLDAPKSEEGLVGSYDGDTHNNDGRNKGGQVFLSVAMDEGISLDDDLARWQVVAKAAYPYMGDKRVDYRLNELDDWTWYSGKAAIALQQAVGRGMRSKDDWCHTHVLDESAAQLIERNDYLFEDWFLDAVGIEPADELPVDRA